MGQMHYHKINSFIWQTPVGDVSGSIYSSSYKRAVRNTDTVVYLVSGFEAAEDRDGGLDGWFINRDGLEATLQRSILTNGLSIFIGL